MKKPKKIVSIFALIVLVIWAIWMLVRPDMFEVFEQRFGNELSEIKTTYGLSDLSYTMPEWKESKQRYNGESFFISSVNIYSSKEFSEFEPSKQYEVMKEIEDAIDRAENASKRGKMILLVTLHRLYCDKDSYRISRFDGTLEKNSEKVYTDPEDYARYQRYVNDSNNSSDSLNTYSSVSTSDNNYWNAVTAAQELVKEKLKSPSTAKFPLDSYSVLRSGSNWMIGGYVDAQNGFGATVRSNWIVTFTMGDTSGSKYKVSNYKVTIY